MLPATISQLLHLRAIDIVSPSSIYFLDNNGNVSNSISYSNLYEQSLKYAVELRRMGLKRGQIVLSSFPDHESHIRLFWACCFAGILFCPLPTQHPDPSRQKSLLEHLQGLFHNPVLIGTPTATTNALSLIPSFRTIAMPLGLPVAFLGNRVETAQNDNSDIFPQSYPRPRDPVALMLTSGSTGNSKAVLLTHRNLLSSIRGKVMHHASSDSSRFLNWIAFDHVACLTEIHLQALQANASQWHIPTTAVVQKPLDFLRATSRYHITYTFSPNFLLAKILSNTSSEDDLHLDFSYLQALISGGESVPLPTALAFADLLERYGSPRNALRAGFGMSETGAGCIYDTRPIPSSSFLTNPSEPAQFLSLGRPCSGLEIRIVNFKNIEAAINQCGSLQLRGPTVFNEYYGDEAATKGSFSADGWFITGDLARIDNDGNLHLMGRDKDCININGVKYSSADVVEYLGKASIQGINYPMIFVCPIRLKDAETESYVVFYQHSDVDFPAREPLNLSPVDLGLLLSTNTEIKQACTVFFCSTSPHIVVPLPSQAFVRTTLGKISPSQLSKAYLNGAYDYIISSLESFASQQLECDVLGTSGVSGILGQAIEDVFDLPKSKLCLSQNLFELGASSMNLLRLKQILQQRLSIDDIPTIELLKRPHIGQLVEFLDISPSSSIPQITQIYQPLICLSSTGSKPPSFLVHPGVGEILVFISLARLISQLDDRPVYALRARGFDTDDPFTSFSEMVKCYTSAIKEMQSQGPYYIAGYSFGGAVAFEIGKMLEAEGKLVAWVGILNLPPHIQTRMKELDCREVLINLGMFLGIINEGDMGNLREMLPVTSGLPTDDVIAELADGLFVCGNPARLTELDLDLPGFVHWIKVAYAINLTGRDYVPIGKLSGALTTVFCAIPLPSMGTRLEFKEKQLSLWSHFCGEHFEMVDVDGEHYTMLGEIHVQSFAEHLCKALRRAGKCNVAR